MPLPEKILKNMPEFHLDESKRKALLIYGGVALVAFAAYFYFFLRPTLSELFGLLPKVREFKVEIRAVKNDLVFEGKLKRKLADLEGELATYEKRLSREKEIPLLLENLSKTARSSRVRIIGVTPVEGVRQTKTAPGKAKEVYQIVPIMVTAQSGYHELGAFINQLENDERYMQVSDIKIKATKGNPKRHDVEFVVYAYTFQKE